MKTKESNRLIAEFMGVKPVMEKRFYVVEKLPGRRGITLYDIDTQAMDMVVVCELEIPNSADTVEALMGWLLENGDDREYEFVRL